MPRARAGAHVPRRQRRGAREVRVVALGEGRRSLGRIGEVLAARFLEYHGVTVLDANVAVGRGEVDLIAMDGPVRTVVEVRTTSGTADPIEAVDRAKRIRVTRLARRIGATRVDFVGVRVDESGLDIHWVPGD